MNENSELIEYLKEKMKEDMPEMVKETEEWKKYWKHKNFVVLIVFYMVEGTTLLSMFLNFYCIFFYEDVYMNVIYTLFVYVLAYGSYVNVIKKNQKDESFTNQLRAWLLFQAIHFLYPIMYGYIVWVVFGFSYALILKVSANLVDQMEMTVFGMKASEYKEKANEKVKAQLVKKYSQPDLVLQLQKQLLEKKMQAQQPGQQGVLDDANAAAAGVL